MLSLAFESCSNSADNENEDLTEFVDPMIGTDFTGNTYPGAQMPFGMVQLSPDNGLPGWDRISGYFYPDSTIAGFSHTQQGRAARVQVIFMTFRLCRCVARLLWERSHLGCIRNSHIRTRSQWPVFTGCISMTMTLTWS